jgi:hypothetical protein
VKNQDSMGKTNSFLSTLSFTLWADLATWLQVGAPQKSKKIYLNTYFELNFTMGSYGVSIGCAWYSRKACEILVHLSKIKN